MYQELCTKPATDLKTTILEELKNVDFHILLLRFTLFP